MADKPEEGEEQKGGKGKLMMIVGAVVLLGGGIFAGPMVQKMMGGGEAEAATAEVEEKKPDPSAEPIYQGIHPPLLINFTDDRGKGRFLQISLDLLTRDPATGEAIKTHAPMIRNNLIILFGDINYQSVSTKEGKAEMLEMALNEINDVLESQTGTRGVEAVFFTNLVVQ